jgi:PEP-CTERM motif-containing protein
MSRTISSCVAAVTLAMGVAACAHAQLIPIDDFDDGNDDGWTHYDFTAGQAWGPGIYDASSGEYLLQGMGPVPPEDPADGLLFSEWDMSADPLFSNGYVRLKIRVNEKNTSAFLLMRTDLSTLSGHLFAVNTELDNFRFFIESYENFAVLGNVTEDGPLYEPDQDWMFEAGAIGNELSLKYWKLGDPEPADPQLTFTDMLGAAGRISLGVSFPGDHNPASLISASFDDLVFIVPEPSTIALASLGLLGIGLLRQKH